MMKFFSTIAFILLVAGAAHLDSQVQAGRRPRVGVALSGGGALGLAHIGVLRYFEEHHIPIDDMAGTSMGGLVGGLYSTGMDSRQITALVHQIDFESLLSPNPKFTDQPIVEKQKWNRTFGDLTFRFGKKFSLPSGLNSGESISLLLSRATLAYSNLHDFDELPTPFRCVATDLISGQAVVLQQGSLALAMRATMSIPGFFTPVKLDDMVLVDGGIVQVVPVDVARGMGAQKVIAVAFRLPSSAPDQLTTLPDILRRTAAIDAAQNERASLAAADLVILVDLPHLTTMSYKSSEEIIDAGYKAAQARAADLRAYEVSDEEWDAYLRNRMSRVRTAERQGAIVAVESSQKSFQQKAQEELHRKLDDRIVPEHELQDVLSGMVTSTAIPGASYEWQNEPGKPQGYKVQFTPRPGDEILVRPSLRYQWSSGEPDRGSLRLSTSAVFRNAYKSRIVGAMEIGYDPGFHAEYYNPFDGTSYFIAPGFVVQRFHDSSYAGPARFTATRDRVGGSFYAGAGTWRDAQLRLGVEAGHDSYSSAPVIDGVKAVGGNYVTPEIRWIINSQDSGGLPTRGTRFEGSAGYSFRNVSYPYFENEFSTLRPVGRFATVFATNQADTSLGRKLDYFDQFTAGGMNQLAAYRYQEFHANTLAIAGGGVIFRDRSAPHPMRTPGFAAWYEAGRFDLGSGGWQTHQSTTTGLFVPTPIGAAGMTLSVDESGKVRFRMLIGSF
jgi:NTE family protein